MDRIKGVDRDTILEGERVYLAGLVYESRSLEDSLFGEAFTPPILARGYLLPQEVLDIVCWKRPSAATKGAPWNSPELIERFSRAAITHHDDARMAIWILIYLDDFQPFRVASSVLAVLFPDEHTVFEAHAWSVVQSLGWAPDLKQVFTDHKQPNEYLDLCASYEAYRGICVQKASEFGVTLTALGRFLFIEGVGLSAEKSDRC